MQDLIFKRCHKIFRVNSEPLNGWMNVYKGLSFEVNDDRHVYTGVVIKFGIILLQLKLIEHYSPWSINFV